MSESERESSGGVSLYSSSSGSRPSDPAARQARSAELKFRRRVTKALAAKRSRKQHGLYVQRLNEEADELRERIYELQQRRSVDAVAHNMINTMAATMSEERAGKLMEWLRSTQLERLVREAEQRERDREEMLQGADDGTESSTEASGTSTPAAHRTPRGKPRSLNSSEGNNSSSSHEHGSSRPRSKSGDRRSRSNDGSGGRRGGTTASTIAASHVGVQLPVAMSVAARVGPGGSSFFHDERASPAFAYVSKAAARAASAMSIDSRSLQSSVAPSPCLHGMHGTTCPALSTLTAVASVAPPSPLVMGSAGSSGALPPQLLAQPLAQRGRPGLAPDRDAPNASRPRSALGAMSVSGSVCGSVTQSPAITARVAQMGLSSLPTTPMFGAQPGGLVQAAPLQRSCSSGAAGGWAHGMGGGGYGSGYGSGYGGGYGSGYGGYGGGMMRPSMPPPSESPNGMLSLLEAAEGLAGMAAGASGARHVHASPRPTPSASGVLGDTLTPEAAAAAMALARATNGRCSSVGDDDDGGAADDSDGYDDDSDGGRARGRRRGREDSDDSEEEGEESESDEDWGQVCFCDTGRHRSGSKFSFGGVWVQCDDCELWCHGECAGVRSVEQAESLLAYRCPKCRHGPNARVASQGGAMRGGTAEEWGLRDAVLHVLTSEGLTQKVAALQMNSSQPVLSTWLSGTRPMRPVAQATIRAKAMEWLAIRGITPGGAGDQTTLGDHAKSTAAGSERAAGGARGVGRPSKKSAAAGPPTKSPKLGPKASPKMGAAPAPVARVRAPPKPKPERVRSHMPAQRPGLRDRHDEGHGALAASTQAAARHLESDAGDSDVEDDAGNDGDSGTGSADTAAANAGADVESSGDPLAADAMDALPVEGAKAEGAKAEGAKTEGAKAEGAKAEGAKAEGAKAEAMDPEAVLQAAAAKKAGSKKAVSRAAKSKPTKPDSRPEVKQDIDVTDGARDSAADGTANGHADGSAGDACARCPAGHLFLNGQVTEDLCCDDCGATIPAGTSCYSCAQCDIDRCWRCTQPTRNEPPKAEHAAKAAATKAPAAKSTAAKAPAAKSVADDGALAEATSPRPRPKSGATNGTAPAPVTEASTSDRPVSPLSSASDAEGKVVVTKAVSNPRFAMGARVSVRFDDAVSYPGTVREHAGTDRNGRVVYVVSFDDGQELDDVQEEEMAAMHRFAVGDRVTVPFGGDLYPGTVDGTIERGTERERQASGRARPTDKPRPLLYSVEFDDGERLSDVTEEELTRITWEGDPMPIGTTGEPVTFLPALRGPQAIKVGDRLRVWWEPKLLYDGVVIEIAHQLGADCKPAMAYRVVYDDGDVCRHFIGDFPMEKLPADPERSRRKPKETKPEARPEAMRQTRVTIAPDA